MKATPFVRRLLKVLITLLGAGLGAAVSALGLQLFRFYQPMASVPLWGLVLVYACLCLVGGILFLLFSESILNGLTRLFRRIVRATDEMPIGRLICAVSGMVLGLIVAALCTTVVAFLGSSLFTTIFSALLFVALGFLGWFICLKRSDDILSWISGLRSGKPHTFRKSHISKKGTKVRLPIKLLDTSALIDGRILAVARAGFLEGELLVPDFILGELNRVAESADPVKRARGRHGLEILDKLKADPHVSLRFPEREENPQGDADMRLLALAREKRCSLVTCDQALGKAAALSGVPVLNVNDLAASLKPVLLPGEELVIRITKEGREANQGVGYLEDGTMIVVENGRSLIGQEKTVVVTSALQTSAGRMIFAKLKAAE